MEQSETKSKEMNRIMGVVATTVKKRITSAQSPGFQQLHALISSLTAADLGVNSSADVFQKLTRNQIIGYQHVYGEEDSPFQIGMFLLPKHTEIPLHDHPEMTVLSKVLSGSLQVSRFDWLDQSWSPAELSVGTYREARISDESLLTPSTDAQVLSPGLGNIHEFFALEDTVVLDMLLPPYSSTRKCSYYKICSCEPELGTRDDGSPALASHSVLDSNFSCPPSPLLFQVIEVCMCLCL
mmetsp:Transcript_39432/g.77575  ORF Transcript_39432/g.77575 Transcript_39432/m.77575 type:complete len:239 (-) Transcript_39432:73-789(-)